MCKQDVASIADRLHCYAKTDHLDHNCIQSLQCVLNDLSATGNAKVSVSVSAPVSKVNTSDNDLQVNMSLISRHKM